MMTPWFRASVLLALGAGALAAAPLDESNVSLRNEVDHAIDRGRAWLVKAQDTNGFWSTPDDPGVTALALTALVGPAPRQPESPAVQKGFAYLLHCAQPDGGIYCKGLASYNTAVSLTALALRNRPDDVPLILKARQFLIQMQATDASLGATNSPFAGGIGYGGREKRPDLSNTMMALEALYNSRGAAGESGAPDLNWKAAIQFIQNCQNLPGSNTQSWVADDPADRGGFVYAPGRSNAGQTNLSSGRVALRSYGSISYAGLLSYIYADMKPDDPRESVALDWLKSNYTVDENPAMGHQGLYYYYVLMAKALTFAGVDALATRDGRSIDWREDLALKLLNLQRADGSWANDNGRWWEKDPALDSAYSLLAMEIIQAKL